MAFPRLVTVAQAHLYISANLCKPLDSRVKYGNVNKSNVIPGSEEGLLYKQLQDRLA